MVNIFTVREVLKAHKMCNNLFLKPPVVGSRYHNLRRQNGRNYVRYLTLLKGSEISKFKKMKLKSAIANIPLYKNHNPTDVF